MTYQSPYQAYPYPWGGVAPAPQYVPPTPSTFQTMGQSQQPPQQQSTGAAPLTGRTVRSAHEVTPQEVPMDGALALFPLADGTAIIGKRWTPEGTIAEVRYVPEAPAPEREKPTFEATVLDRLSGIEEAIAGLVAPAQQPRRQTRRPKGETDES